MKILGLASKIAVFLLILGILAALGSAIIGGGSRAPRSSPLVGKKAPDFNLLLFSGGYTSLERLRGKTVLLNFWASWCLPCREEAAAIESSWKKYSTRDAAFLGVNVWDDSDAATRFIQKYTPVIPHGTDPKGKIAVDYGVSGVPETYFIDPDGNVIDRFSGGLTPEIIDYYMAKAMAGGTAEDEALVGDDHAQDDAKDNAKDGKDDEDDDD